MQIMIDDPAVDLVEKLRDLTFLKLAIDEHAIVSTTDDKGNITSINDRFCAISGYSRDELMGQNHRMLKSGEHSPKFYEDLWQTITNGTPWHGEIKNARKDGSIYWVKATIVPFLNEQGKPFQYISIRTDITERRNMEDALGKFERRFRMSQYFANIGTWDWNIQSGELHWSERISVLFGGEEGVLETSYDNFLNAIHPDDRQMVVDAVNGCVKNDAIYNIEHRVVWPDETVHWLHESGNVVRDADGTPLSMLGVVQDVTNRRQAEEDLRHTKQEAEVANQAKSEFLSSMSHELRTPMNAILGFTQMLQFNPKEPLTETQNSSVDIILQGGNHLLELINQVLELSKIEAGHLSLNVDHIPARDVIDESLNMIVARADMDGIAIIDQIGSTDLPVLWTDKTRLTQVLLNLFSNAVKYNRENGTVTLTCQELPDQILRISVADTGFGIPTEKQDDLFKPFERLGLEAGTIEGTGIGLTITKQIIELLGGHIGFESEVGKGSTFWIDVPMSEKQDNETVHLEIAKSTGKIFKKLGEEGSQYSILYVEDNPANMQLMEMIIGRIGNTRLLTARNAELGLDLAKSEHPDLILMDINLPGMNGIEALMQLQNMEETKNIPVIAITAAAIPKDVEAGVKAGFRDYITKPINVPEVIWTIEEILDSIEKSA